MAYHSFVCVVWKLSGLGGVGQEKGSRVLDDGRNTGKIAIIPDAVATMRPQR